MDIEKCVYQYDLLTFKYKIALLIQGKLCH